MEFCNNNNGEYLIWKLIDGNNYDKIVNKTCNL